MEANQNLIISTTMYDIIIDFACGVKRILGNNLKQVILYGSYARGDFNTSSDIDIMVLTTLIDSEIEQVEYDIYGLAFDFQMDYGVDISVVIKNEEQFNYWLGVLPFYDNVKKRVLWSMGDCSVDLKCYCIYENRNFERE